MIEPQRARLLLTAEEAADLLNIGRSKVYDLIRNGDLRSLKIGRLRRVPLDAVREFAAGTEAVA